MKLLFSIVQSNYKSLDLISLPKRCSSSNQCNKISI